jgi:ubiquinol-cytochrome c reductase cytochrome c subunit
VKRLAVICLAFALCAGPASAAQQQRSPQVVRGEHLFGQYCVACHGMNGSGVVKPKTIGNAPGRQQTQQQAVAPSLQGVGAQAADFYLRTGYMPLQKLGLQPRRSTLQLSDRQIRDLIAYVASLGPGPPIPVPHPERGNLSQGMHLFTDHCAGCHQVVAEGGYVTCEVPPPLEDATTTQIAEAVRIGPNVMPKFSTKAITPQQLDSIIAYVQYAKHPDDRGGWAIGHLGPLPEGLVTWFLAAAALVFTCMVIGKRLKSE